MTIFNEFSVACLLENNSVAELKKHISFLDKENHPHISLFQLQCDIDFLPLLREFAQNLDISSFFLPSGINLVENNIFLDVLDDGTLQNASNKLADFYSKHYQRKQPLSQINTTNLNKTELDLVNKYGIYWIKENYRPHVTLSYENHIKQNLNCSLPNIIYIQQIMIYKIDAIGRIKVFDV